MLNPDVISDFAVLLSLDISIYVSIFLFQDEQSLTSRRKYMTCICSSLVLINTPAVFAASPKGSGADVVNGATATERAACRNCGGSGAIICENEALPLVPVLFFSCDFTHLFPATHRTKELRGDPTHQILEN